MPPRPIIAITSYIVSITVNRVISITSIDEVISFSAINKVPIGAQSSATCDGVVPITSIDITPFIISYLPLTRLNDVITSITINCLSVFLSTIDNIITFPTV